MEATEDPLSELADIHLPAEVSFWPPAPGWWVVAVLVLAALAYGGFLLYRRWQRQQKLDMALMEIQQVHKLYSSWQQSSADDTGTAGITLLHGCNSVLKRVALVHYPEQEVASLNGPAWLRFLDRTGNTDAFTNGHGRVLGDGAYRRSWQADAVAAEALVQESQSWIKRQYRLSPAAHEANTAKPAAEPHATEAQA